MLSLRQRAHRILLALLPGFITLLFTLLMLVAQRRFGLAGFMPLLPLLAIYYWSIHAPKRMPYGIAFIAGLLYDSMLGLPLGLSSLFFMLFKWLLHSQRRTFSKEAFGILWMTLAVLTAFVLLGQWSITALYLESRPPMAPAFVQYMLTVLLYPLLHGFFLWLDQVTHRRVLLALHH